MRILNFAVIAITSCAMLWKTSAPAQAGEGYFYKKGTVWAAAQNGDLPGVKKMLAATPALLNQRSNDEFKDTLLEAAAHGGNYPIFQYVSARGAAFTKDQIMLHAAASGNMQIIKLVAAKGANVNARRADSGDTPLMWAAQDHGKVDVLTFLVSKGADVKAKEKKGLTALIYASYPGASISSTNWHSKPKDKLAALRYLLSKGAAVNDQSKNGETCLFLAVSPDYPRTPTACAASEQLTQFLLSKGANPNLGRDSDGEKPVLNSVANYQISGAKTPHELKSGLNKLTLLLQYKADPNIQSRSGLAALHELLRYHGNDLRRKESPTKTETIMLATKALLKAGANPDLKDKSGKSPRDMVREAKGRWALAPLFGIDLETPPTPNGTTPIITSDTVVRSGEISLSGSVVSIDGANSKLVLQSIAFGLPSGKSATLAVPKEKLVVVSETTLIHLVDKPDQKIAISDIKPNDNITVIGADEGTGSEMIAREIIIRGQ